MRDNRFTALASVPLVLEYEAVLKRPEHLSVGGRTEAMTDAFLDSLCLRLEPVHLYYLWRPKAGDPADDMVLETAINGRADTLVTLNVNDFRAADQFCLNVQTPGAILRKMIGDNR